MIKIIIETRQGLIDAVYSTSPNISVRLLDRDSIDSNNPTVEQKEMLDEIIFMKDVYNG